jgi:hypothetical protein
MLQRSDARMFHGFGRAQENEQGTEKIAPGAAMPSENLRPEALLLRRTQIGQFFGRNGAAVEKALNMAAACRTQGIGLAFPFNPFGHRLHAQRCRKIHDRADNSA